MLGSSTSPDAASDEVAAEQRRDVALEVDLLVLVEAADRDVAQAAAPPSSVSRNVGPISCSKRRSWSPSRSVGTTATTNASRGT